MSQKIVIVEGLIAVGKSTILSQIDQETSRVFKEEYDEDKIRRHYENPTPENSLNIQEEFYDQLWVKMRQISESDKHAFLDRSLVGNLAFTLLNISIGNLPVEGGRELVLRLLDDLWKLSPSDSNSLETCIVYLMDDLEKIQSRVRSRGREMEKNLTIDYQRKLHIWYVIVLSHMKAMGYPLLVLHGLDSFKVLSESSPEEVMKMAREYDEPMWVEFDILEYINGPVRDIEDIISVEL